MGMLAGGTPHWEDRMGLVEVVVTVVLIVVATLMEVQW